VDGSGHRARAVAAALVVLAALGLVALAARSGRTETVTPLATHSRSAPSTPATSRADKQVDTGEARPSRPPDGPPPWAVILVIAILLAVGGGTATWGWAAGGLARIRIARRRSPPPAPADPPEPGMRIDDPAVLALAVEAGLRELEDGEPADGIVACWVQLERAAADAGAERALPETPSELAGRLIDTQDVTPGPLLRLAELYREARYSRHRLGEAARTEARLALEEVRADLAVSTALRSARASGARV
jgi:Domain of unknown function (DUF4129)